MKPALLCLLLASTDALRVAPPARAPFASTDALRAPPRLRIALRSEPEEATPEVDTTAVEARSRALAASKLSVAAVVASAVRAPVAGGAAARLVAGAGLVAAAPLAATAFATLADGDATRPLRAALAAAHASAVYAACRAAGGPTRGVLVATHAYALLVAAWPFDGPAAAWSEATRPELDRQWAAIALALFGGAGYWLYANATPLVLALAPWAVVGAAAAAQKARAPSKDPRRGPLRVRRRRVPGERGRCRDDWRAQPGAAQQAPRAVVAREGPRASTPPVRLLCSVPGCERQRRPQREVAARRLAGQPRGRVDGVPGRARRSTRR